MSNIFYILNESQIDMVDQCSEIVETSETVRYSTDETKFVCKLMLGVSSCEELAQETPYTHAQILDEMNKQEWNNNV